MPDLGLDDERENSLLREEMLAVISKLPLAFRRLVTAYFFEDKSHEEIAVEENITLETSRTRLHRAKAKLRMYLQNNL